MCRLFGLTAGTVRVRATFWLLDAPDSLEAQSRRNVDELSVVTHYVVTLTGACSVRRSGHYLSNVVVYSAIVS